ncbi:hypothetical protein CR513_05644, partial [Mucuna pruriens]
MDMHTHALILALLKFTKSFKLECDASNVGIRAVLLQEGHPISYFHQKLKGAYINYSTYDKEFYALLGPCKRHVLLAMLEKKLLGFECIKEFYTKDEDFKETYELCANSAKGGFFRHEGFLFKDRKLCVLRSFIRKLLAILGEVKTYETLVEHFYWPHIRRDVHHVCEQCLFCKGEKSKVSPHGFYTPLSIPTFLWVDISMVLSYGCLDLRIAHFIPCHKVNDACHVAIFFREVVRLHGLPKTISKLGTKLLFSTTCHPQTDGQTKVVNRTLSQLLRCFIVSSTTSYSPFELVYKFNPLTPLDLLPLLDMASKLNEYMLSKSQFVKKLHERDRYHIEKKVDQYAKQANKGRKEKRDGHFKILKRVKDNSHIVDMPQDFRGSNTFIVSNLSPCVSSTSLPNLRANSLQEGEHDVDCTHNIEET